jgi:ABC-type iron transport system FetAB ATPase subunit
MIQNRLSEKALSLLEDEKEIEEKFSRVEYLEMEVALLRREVSYLMQTVTLLAQVENYRIEKIRKK